MMLAELTGLEIGSIVTGFVFGSIGLLIAGVAAFKKTEVAVDQPVSVEVIEALHKQFAAKNEFDRHVLENSDRHALIFAKIEQSELRSQTDLEKAVLAIQEDRRRTWDKLENRNERIMFALGKIASSQGIDITPTE